MTTGKTGAVMTRAFGEKCPFHRESLYSEPLHTDSLNTKSRLAKLTWTSGFLFTLLKVVAQSVTVNSLGELNTNWGLALITHGILYYVFKWCVVDYSQMMKLN